MNTDRGQGANNGFADAWKFVQAIEKVVKHGSSLEEAIGEYELDVRTRGLREVEISRSQMDAHHSFEEFLRSPVMKYGLRPARDG